jgi:UDP-glucose 4-epimerase
LINLDLQIKLRNLISGVAIKSQLVQKMDTHMNSRNSSALKALLKDFNQTTTDIPVANNTEVELQNSYNKSKYAINEMLRKISMSKFNQDPQKNPKRPSKQYSFY